MTATVLADLPAVELDREERLAAMRSGEVGAVHSWELVTAVDGPGTRMTTFLTGCPLRCLYCQNPDTWRMRDGTEVRADDLVARVARYRPVFEATGGGLTLSGGEPLMQPRFVARVLRGVKQLGVRTALDTSGFLGAAATDEMLDDVDLVLLDVKAGDEETYRRATGRTLRPTIDFGDRLAARGTEVWVRFVLVPGLTDAVDNVENVARIVERWPNVTRVEILPFHQLGRGKWERLDTPYALADVAPPSPELVARVRRQFEAHGLPTYVG